MKRLLKFTLQVKTYASLLFTCTILLYMAVAWFAGWADSMRFSTILQLLAVSLVVVLLQGIAFSDAVFRHMRYSRRALLFVCLFLPALVGFALGFSWFPAENLYGWLLFLGIFLFVLVVMTIGFEVYFKIQGKKYDGLLGQYRKERDQG